MANLTKIDKLKTITDVLTGFSPDRLETYLKWIDEIIDFLVNLDKANSKEFLKWERESREKLVNDYQFDIDETIRYNIFEAGGSFDNICGIKGYWEWAIGMYDSHLEDLTYDKEIKNEKK